MWSRLDDALIDHQKVFRAGALLGPDGPLLTIGFFSLALMWSNKHLSEGFLPRDVVKKFPHTGKPLVVADALTKAGLFDRVKGGFQIHDFAEYNAGAAVVRQRRRADRLRKQAERARVAS